MSLTWTHSKPAASRISPSGTGCASPGGTQRHASTSAIGFPEFTAHWHVARHAWLIRRRGAVYLEIPAGPQWPAHTATYVRRCLAALNGEAS